MRGEQEVGHEWGEQAEALRAQRDNKDHRDLELTTFGYAQAQPTDPTSFGVRWSEHPDKHEPCVAVLRRYGSLAEPAVLLLPGATAWRDTFFQPNLGLVGRLLKEGYCVWTLDWRGTKVITDIWRGQDRTLVPDAITGMTLRQIAEQEVPAAVAEIRNRSNQSLSIIGHCIGSGVLALSIAAGKLQPGAADLARTPIVLSTLGLFYRGAVDTWLRANERIDRARIEPSDPKLWYIDFAVDSDSKASWPEIYESFYGLWTKTPYPHCESDFCRRMSSVIGAPYRPDDIGYLHDDERNGLAVQFGVLPLSLLDDIARAVRRGLIHGETNGETLQERFKGFCVSLITGRENQLWHRDSIDRMEEWLRRCPGLCVDKRVFSRYGHQDLWWSPRAAEPDGIYDHVISRLAPPRI